MENSSPAVEASSPMNSASQASPRRRSVAERRGIVEASLAPGATAAKVAAKYGMHVTHLYWLRKQYREGRLGVAPPAAPKLLPVQVVKSGKARTDRRAEPAGWIELELAHGQVRVSGVVDAAALRLVLECLR